MITKTNFITYMFDAPLHMWAEKHAKIEIAPSAYDLHLMEQGKAIEKLANEFLRGCLTTSTYELMPQKTFTDGDFQARVDVLALDTGNQVYDIYEIKSSTSIRKDYIYDVAFQRVVCEATIPVRSAYLVLLNKEYVRSGEIDLNQLFIIENLTEESAKVRDEVAVAREDARLVATKATPTGIANCLKPDRCPCPSLCHPELPEYPIYNIPRLNQKKARGLIGRAVFRIKDIPNDFPLSDRQTLHMLAVKQGKPLIDIAAIKDELDRLQYPLYFLDYETYNPAVPLFDGYKPYQPIVFQYSLHVIAEPGSVPEHFECLITEQGDPGNKVVQHLIQHMGRSGSVVVWNKTFEAGRNKEMAQMYPEYGDFLLGVNDRMYDLMDPFSKGYYVHPDFRGSASIKNVLPVLVDDGALNYDDLPISRGDDAMLAWADIMTGRIPGEKISETRENLLRYCELDTLAMVRIWEVLSA
ncbi:MAG: DUF2779 domain-containing protein [Anaerolineales bacterium]